VELSYQVELKTSGKSFSVEADETVLEAALRQSINLPYGCKNGACGSCKGRLLTGKITHGDHSQSALSPADETAGATLLCCAHPQTDLLIEVREVQGGGDIPVRKVPCRINTIKFASDDVAILQLQLPASERFQFLAGQYLEFLLKDNKRRAYSIASAPHEEGPLELHIRHLPGGLFTDPLFGQTADGKQIKEKDILRFEGPLGSFFLREDSKKPIIFLASGTGFAPIKAILTSIQNKKIDREIHFYWGGRRPKDLYMDSLCQEFTHTIPGFHYTPVISEALPEDAWQGRTGFVHRAVMHDFSDLSSYQVYACGAPIVIAAARTDFVKECRLPEEEFFADSFTSEADLISA
jgi:CDP-4-dehydro-6-deoxyglucose reductase